MRSDRPFAARDNPDHLDNLIRPQGRLAVPRKTERRLGEAVHSLLGRHDRLQRMQHAASDALDSERPQRVRTPGAARMESDARPHAGRGERLRHRFDGPDRSPRSTLAWRAAAPRRYRRQRPTAGPEGLALHPAEQVGSFHVRWRPARLASSIDETRGLLGPRAGSAGQRDDWFAARRHQPAQRLSDRAGSDNRDSGTGLGHCCHTITRTAVT